MSWNYRICEYDDGATFALHEVYYDKDGIETSMTVDPTYFAAETPEGVVDNLVMARMDAMQRPIFKVPQEW